MGNQKYRQEFIKTFSELGNQIAGIPQDELQNLSMQARNENPWFTPENIEFGLKSIGQMLEKDALEQWFDVYGSPSGEVKVGLILAGNIPMVGFHDLMCVLASGHHALVKLSSKDSVLMKYLINSISHISPQIGKNIEIRELLKDMDAVIATGSDNSARYFETYFGKYPNVIRKNRTSAAVIRGNETTSDLELLGKDIFTYFGLGCRNVSKLYVPKDYNFTPFFESIEGFSSVAHHHKYSNNYDFNKSVYLVNKESHLDNGFLLLKPSEELVSPVSVVYFETYKDQEHLSRLLEQQAPKLQCIVEAAPESASGHIPFGHAQQPGLSDYADKVDTMKFLVSLG